MLYQLYGQIRIIGGAAPRFGPRAVPNIIEVRAEWVNGRTLEIQGRVQSVIERHARVLVQRLARVSSIERALCNLGGRDTQVNIVGTDMRSYVAFASTSDLVIGRGILVAATLRPQYMAGLGTIFFCDGIHVL